MLKIDTTTPQTRYFPSFGLRKIAFWVCNSKNLLETRYFSGLGPCRRPNMSKFGHFWVLNFQHFFANCVFGYRRSAHNGAKKEEGKRTCFFRCFLVFSKGPKNIISSSARKRSQPTLGLSDVEKRGGTHKLGPKLGKLWVSGHVHTKTNLNKFGFKPTIFRV